MSESVRFDPKSLRRRRHHHRHHHRRRLHLLPLPGFQYHHLRRHRHHHHLHRRRLTANCKPGRQNIKIPISEMKIQTKRNFRIKMWPFPKSLHWSRNVIIIIYRACTI